MNIYIILVVKTQKKNLNPPPHYLTNGPRLPRRYFKNEHPFQSRQKNHYLWKVSGKKYIESFLCIRNMWKNLIGIRGRHRTKKLNSSKSRKTSTYWTKNRGFFSSDFTNVIKAIYCIWFVVLRENWYCTGLETTTGNR